MQAERIPVVVGVGAVNRQAEDPTTIGEPIALMEEAIRLAAKDAGSDTLLAVTDRIIVPRGFWAYSDPGRLLADRIGAAGARTVVAEIGILQSSLLGRAASEIAAGKSEVAILVGGEAHDRAARLGRAGKAVPLTVQQGVAPDVHLEPASEIMGRHEIELGLVTPTIQYAVIDNALRFAEGKSIAEHKAELGRLWGDFNRVAVDNPHAWNRKPMSGEEIVTPTEANRLLAFPYTKHLVSQWNVNQAGALVVCSLAKARQLGLDAKRFVYPLAVVDSEHMVTLSERRELHRSAGFELVFARLLERFGRGVEALDAIELYSCFPAAVRIQQRALGVEPGRRVTQTGGMTFGGGPLNNFVIQSFVKMIECLRAKPGSHGLVSAVSGLITKQGASLFGPEPSIEFAHEQVTDAARRAQATVAVDPAAKGRARVASYTVSQAKDVANGVALFLDLEDGRRTLRVDPDPELAALAMREELCGRTVEVGATLRFA
ncbi:acetyl-CoA acetyltransferase [Myxococcota bacterium]|nr:acetyl-CoA acetyltransferase [Myxococcota bacterium]